MSSFDPTAYGRWLDTWRQVAPALTPLTWTNAHLIGPFDNTEFRGLFAAYGPEESIDLTASYTGKGDLSVSWRRVPELDNAFDAPLDLSALTDAEPWSVFYVYAEVEVAEPQIAHLAVNVSNASFAWVNGQQVLAPMMPVLPSSELTRVMVPLKPGVNRVLCKVLFTTWRWDLVCRLEAYGAAEGLVDPLVALIEKTDDATTRMTARYQLVEAYAVSDDTVGVAAALQALESDPIANPWDVAWADSLRAQRAETGSYLPLHDVAQRYEPVTDVGAYDTFWPKSSPPAEKLLVLDVSEAAPQVEFAMGVLQGIVNRTQPRLYLLHTRYARQDREWLDELEYEGYGSREVSVTEVWEAFRDEVKGAVVYDGDIMDEIGDYHSNRLNQTNVLMMICALEDAVPLTSEMAAEQGLPVLHDARGKWASQYEMMSWAYVNLFPHMNHRILATNYPGIFLITDYLVQHRIFTFWFPEHRTMAEENLLCGILASTPPNTPIVGWWFDWMPNYKDPEHRAADAVLEGPGLLHGSYFGKVLTPSHEATNLSVHSGVEVGDWRHKAPEVPEVEPDKIYYAHVISDGDNLGEALMLQTRERHWDRPERGSFPMGWSLAPAAAVIAPAVYNYYIRTATANDLLVGGLGIGYTFPSIYLHAYPEHQGELYAAYARLTNEAMKWLDTSCLWLFEAGLAQEDAYALGSDGQLQGVFNGYGGGPEIGSVRTGPNDVVIFRSVTSAMEGMPRDEIVDLMVKEIRQATADLPRPACIWAWVLNWAWSMDQLQEVQRRLGDEFVAVRPDVLAAMARKHARDDA